MNTLPHRSLRGLLCRFLVLVAALGFIPAAGYAQSTNATIAGRVFNPATGEYVHNAEVRIEGTDRVVYTSDDGSFRISGLTAGDVSVTVRYTGYQTSRTAVNLTAGQTATREFTLQSAGGRPIDPSLPASATDASVVTLGTFTVSAEREGNAKAIMDQRAALNVKNVVASDNFGDIAEGNVGEFLKFVPGLTLDYVDADTRAVRVAGLDPKYSTVTMDGNRIAGAQSSNFGGATRQFEFEQVSINNIEAVEVNKTLTADMDADAPAGAINLRSKNAFERKGRRISFQVNAIANSYELHYNKTPGPDDGHHRKIRPGGLLDYSDVFLDGRLGVQFTVSDSNAYTETFTIEHGFDYGDPARGPVLRSIQWREGPKFTRRAGGSLNMDFKVTPSIVASLRSSFFIFDDSINNRNFTLSANRADIDPSSTLTRVIARATNNTNTSLSTGSVRANKAGDTLLLAPKVEYKHESLTVTLGGSYSRARNRYDDLDDGHFAQANMRISRIGWIAERSDPSSTAWNITQVGGRGTWYDANNWNRDDAFANNVSAAHRHAKNQQMIANLDLKKTFDWRLPFTFQTGVKTRESIFDLDRYNLSMIYVGPTGNQLAPEASLAPFISAYQFEGQKGGNLFQPGRTLPFPDRHAIYKHYVANPTQFTLNEASNFSSNIQANRDLKEQIDSAYISGATNWGKLRLQSGLRWEQTRVGSKVIEPLPDAQVRAAGYTANTIPFIAYKYRNGERESHWGKYDNLFFSGSGKYSFTENLIGQLSYSESILRPNYDNLAGAITIDETNLIATIPNPNLQPEDSQKYYGGVQYYFEPAGTLGVGVFVLDIQNQLDGRSVISQAEASYADDPEFNGYTFRTFRNGPGTQRNRGLELEYSQQLTFLPGPFSGLRVFGSYTRLLATRDVVGFVGKTASGGIGYRNHRWNAQLKTSWNDDRLNGTSGTEVRRQKERLLFDLSTGMRISRHLELFLSGRNILNEPTVYYSNEPGRLYIHQNFGAQWTFGVKGTY